MTKEYYNILALSDWWYGTAPEKFRLVEHKDITKTLSKLVLDYDPTIK